MPTFNDLYYAQIGDSKLSPEFTDQFNVGASYQKEFPAGFISRFGIQVDAYYAFITDKIVAAPTGSFFR